MKLTELIPPVIKDFLKRNFSKYGWFGDYSSWGEAKSKSTGYDSKEILLKVKDSLLKVKGGSAISERDSTLFDKIQPSSIIRSGFFLAKKNNSLSVLDFGGSLGSTYFQHKFLLDRIKKVNYSIVEQKAFVKVGKKYFQDNQLKFYETIEECIKKESPEILILSSVLQYLEKPYEFIKSVIDKNFKIIVIDRTPFVEGEDRITLQKVNPKIYKASYPCWFFNEKKFKKMFKEKYNLIQELEALDKANIRSKFKGLLFIRK